MNDKTMEGLLEERAEMNEGREILAGAINGTSDEQMVACEKALAILSKHGKLYDYFVLSSSFFERMGFKSGFKIGIVVGILIPLVILFVYLLFQWEL